MSKITLSTKEYQELLDRKIRYEQLRAIIEEDIFSPPPTRNIKEIIAAFRATRRYNAKFIEALKKGLGRSAYFK